MFLTDEGHMVLHHFSLRSAQYINVFSLSVPVDIEMYFYQY